MLHHARFMCGDRAVHRKWVLSLYSYTDYSVLTVVRECISRL